MTRTTTEESRQEDPSDSMEILPTYENFWSSVESLLGPAKNIEELERMSLEFSTLVHDSPEPQVTGSSPTSSSVTTKSRSPRECSPAGKTSQKNSRRVTEIPIDNKRWKWRWRPCNKETRRSSSTGRNSSITYTRWIQTTSLPMTTRRMRTNARRRTLAIGPTSTIGRRVSTVRS